MPPSGPICRRGPTRLTRNEQRARSRAPDKLAGPQVWLVVPGWSNLLPRAGAPAGGLVGACWVRATGRDCTPGPCDLPSSRATPRMPQTASVHDDCRVCKRMQSAPPSSPRSHQERASGAARLCWRMVPCSRRRGERARTSSRTCGCCQVRIHSSRRSASERGVALPPRRHSTAYLQLPTAILCLLLSTSS